MRNSYPPIWVLSGSEGKKGGGEGLTHDMRVEGFADHHVDCLFDICHEGRGDFGDGVRPDTGLYMLDIYTTRFG